MSWKKKLAAGASLAALGTVTIHLINKFIFLSATVGDLLGNPPGTWYDWKFGKVYYTKQGDGAPLLLIHDLSVCSSGYEWKKAAPLLAKTNTVYVIDLPGCGRSEKPNLTYGELLEIYGTPKEIADSYIESLDPEEYAEDIRRIKRKKWMFGIVFFSVIAFAIVYLLHLTIVGWQTRPVSYTETIEIIEEE